MMPWSHLYVADHLLSKMKAKILQCLGYSWARKGGGKMNTEGGPQGKTIPFMSSFLHVLDSCPTDRFPRLLLKLNTAANC